MILLSLVKRFFWGTTIILFSFIQAGNKKDSVDSKNNEHPIKIYILEGTIISGADKLSNAEIKTIKKNTIVCKTLVKSSSRKPDTAEKEKKVKDKKIHQEPSIQKVEISSIDEGRAYRSLLFIELQATKISDQPAYDFSPFCLPLLLMVPSEKTITIFFKNSGKTFSPDRYSPIRPPPVISA
ncbi:hypothetical protein [Chryseobacterium shigense]|uniref:hypothetical protein n=1 Tax=Chryseobacterium shigense TaxID=297244 RepID=UPI000F4F3250|nr:hypothetical protein [Chryseobacterium shigense]